MVGVTNWEEDDSDLDISHLVTTFFFSIPHFCLIEFFFILIQVMDPIPLSILKIERCPQISAEDVIELLDLNHKRFAKPKMIVVDVRNKNK